MGFFDHLGRRKAAGDPLAGGADGVFEVLDGNGRLVRYVPDDFDEIWTTTDEHEAGHHVSLGWILLDEVVGEGEGRGDLEFRMQPTGEGRYQSAPSYGPPENVTTYILGYVKDGHEGTPVES